MRALVLTLAFTASCMAGVSSAFGAFPGENGKIAFDDLTDPATQPRRSIYSVNPDGTDLQQLTVRKPFANTNFVEPSFSPSGGKIAYSADGRIWLMDADGTDKRRLTHFSESRYTFDASPSFSPDGRLIVFERAEEHRGHFFKRILVMRRDGTKKVPISKRYHQYHTASPVFSPDGDTIAFAGGTRFDGDIWTVRLDGTGLRRITRSPADDRGPDFSPDGRTIVFSRQPRDPGVSGLRAVPADGGSVVRVPGGQNGTFPAFSPDGTSIVFAGYGPSGGSSLQILELGATASTTLDPTVGWEARPSWQPLPPHR